RYARRSFAAPIGWALDAIFMESGLAAYSQVGRAVSNGTRVSSGSPSSAFDPTPQSGISMARAGAAPPAEASLGYHGQDKPLPVSAGTAAGSSSPIQRSLSYLPERD